MLEFDYTIIIPHYDIPESLLRCLDSIPVRDDIQIIVVDDCSPNASSYLDTYPELSRLNLEFYSTEKGGSAGRARNVGLSHAKGKWLIFADADDLFSEDFSDILNEYRDNQNDIVFFNCAFVLSSDITQAVERKDSYLISQLFDSDNPELKARCCCPVPWGKIIKKSLVDAIGAKFDETRWSNDIVFSAAVGCAASSVLIVDRVLYKTTLRDNSLTSAFCYTRDELIVRTIESLRAQQIINHYNKGLNEYIYLQFIRRAFRSDCKLFWTIIFDLKSYDICWIRVLKQMADELGWFRLVKSFGRYSILEQFRKFKDYYSYKEMVDPLQLQHHHN